MRVLVVTNMFPTAEHPFAGIFVQRQIDALRRADSSLTIDVCHIDTPGDSTRYLTCRGAVARRIAAFEPDVVHIHYGLTQLLVGATRCPRVVTFHGSDLAVGWQRAISRACSRGAAARIVVAPHMRESLGQGATEVDVIPHGVQTERFSAVPRDVARRVMGLPEDALVVGFASSPSRRVKDHALFRAAIAGLPDAMGVALGAVTPELMPTWLSSLDVLLLTSRSEGSPVITKEALCVGTRVVSVDVGDVRDQLEAMSGCAVVESRNPRDLADATRRCLRLPPPDAQEARRRFDVAREAKSVAEVYRRVVGSA